MPKADLLGHSMGQTVMAFAEAHPGMVNKLIVADIATKAYTPHHGPIFDVCFRRPPIGQRQESVQDDLARALGRQAGAFDERTASPQRGRFAWRFNVPVLSKALDDVVGEVSIGMNTLPTLIIGARKPLRLGRGPLPWKVDF